MVDNSVRKISAPLSISQKSIKTFISGASTESLVGPDVLRAVIAQVKKTTIFNKTAELRYVTIISNYRAKFLTGMHNLIKITHTNKRQARIRCYKILNLSPYTNSLEVMGITIDTD